MVWIMDAVLATTLRKLSTTPLGSPVLPLEKITVAVSLGRLIGFDRLVDIDDQVEDQLDTTISTQAPAEDDVRSGDSAG